MDVIILAGGFGTRLAPLFPTLPKALVPIQGVPFLHLVFQQLQRAKMFSKIVLALGHKATSIEQWIATSGAPFPVVYSVEDSPLGTGGALLQALQHTDTETVLAMNGDTYFDLSFTSFAQFHRGRRALFSIACREEEDVSRYGSLEVDPSGQVVAFAEKKPSMQPMQKGWISGGIYLMQRSALATFPQGPSSLERDILPQFLGRGLFACPQTGTFIDIGTPPAYERAQDLGIENLSNASLGHPD